MHDSLTMRALPSLGDCVVETFFPEQVEEAQHSPLVAPLTQPDHILSAAGHAESRREEPNEYISRGSLSQSSSASHHPVTSRGISNDTLPGKDGEGHLVTVISNRSDAHLFTSLPR